MGKTAECPNALGVFEAMAINTPGCPTMLMKAGQRNFGYA